MKIFLTGATGYIGSVLLEHLLAAGHQVEALTRTDAGAAQLTDAGAGAVLGALTDTEVLRAAAARADAVVHAAFDPAASPQAAATELAAVRALAAGASESGTGTSRTGWAGTGKPVLYTSTALVYGTNPDQDRHEDAHLPRRSAQPVKVEAEGVLLATEGITPVVMRVALVHGRGGSGLVTGLIARASATGTAAYVADGAQVWDAIDVDDLAELYLAALAQPRAGIYNAKGSHPFTLRELAEAISEVTGAQPLSLPRASAGETLGPLALVLGAPGTLAGQKARSTFGWVPVGGSLLDDVRTGSYLADPRTTVQHTAVQKGA